MFHRLFSMTLGACIAAAAPIASAAPVTFTVNLTLPANPTPGLFDRNIIRDGVRISPNCHIDQDPTGLPSPSFGFDSASCGVRGGFNENFLGPAEYRAAEMTRVEPVIYVDAFGAPFALRQITIGSYPFILETNRISFSSPPFGFGVTTFDFSANTFYDPITYFLLRYQGDDPGAPGLGFSNVVVTLFGKVPVPGSLALLGGAALAYALVRRRRQPGSAMPQHASSISAT